MQLDYCTPLRASIARSNLCLRSHIRPHLGCQVFLLLATTRLPIEAIFACCLRYVRAEAHKCWVVSETEELERALELLKLLGIAREFANHVICRTNRFFQLG